MTLTMTTDGWERRRVESPGRRLRSPTRSTTMNGPPSHHTNINERPPTKTSAHKDDVTAHKDDVTAHKDDATAHNTTAHKTKTKSTAAQLHGRQNEPTAHKRGPRAPTHEGFRLRERKWATTSPGKLPFPPTFLTTTPLSFPLPSLLPLPPSIVPPPSVAPPPISPPPFIAPPPIASPPSIPTPPFTTPSLLHHSFPLPPPSLSTTPSPLHHFPPPLNIENKTMIT
ncbi:uncharacterized protein LACBIDRAFT_328524 [Laccaria bicolor S238N-H82]|uniref:Predicted protein n=1 Tax=Laccaria bicolor (strain S238N-H82 / ATCC MYA-4686) TaxID=486041 RepID=B0DF51_LACBS|nr:uncharacterized protein LACBIDRAFT_328524 [Laccaria bicolor S238N-H82]EDR06793.1 predicted protein [Laccaria bicolor S238N-H82]|eukprot:XP_001882640.1 predicted protein [Laccaria bicolor S238N-H82]